MGVLLFFMIAVVSYAQIKTFTYRKTVRVGYFYDDGFHAGQSDLRMKSGYGYDYYQAVSDYVPWDYEYVYGCWGEIYEKLLAGEVDIVADMSVTEERKSQMLFSALPMGEEHYYVFVPHGTDFVEIGKNKSLNGKRFCVDKNSLEESIFDQYIKDNKINCEIIPCSGITEKLSKLKLGEADGIISTDGLTSGGLKPVILIGSSDFNFAVNKNKPELLEDLDYAMMNILENNPGFNNSLKGKYFSDISINNGFSPEQREWLAQHNIIKIGYRAESMPFSDYNRHTNSVDGLLKDLIDRSNASSDFLLVPVLYENNNAMANALRRGDIDCMFPVMDNIWLSEQLGYKQTHSLGAEKMALVFQGEYKGLSNYKRFGYTYGSPFQKVFMIEHKLAEDMIVFDRIEDSLKAIKNGYIDSIVINNTGWRYIKKNYPEFRNLETVVLDGSVGFSFAVSKDNFMLLSILNNLLDRIDKSIINESLNKYSQLEDVYSIKDFLKHNTVFVSLLAGFLILILLISGYFIQRNSMQKKYLKFASEHDGLTGVYNRTGFYRLSALKDDDKKKLCFAIVDIDDFKNINDTYGHEAGDKVLKYVSEELIHSVRGNDKIIRYGGDEFILMMYGLEETSKQVIELKAKYLNQKLQNPKGNVPAVTVSIGAAFSNNGYSKDLFNRADEALYTTKKRGKSGITIHS